jgi:SH3-like domain-containing protein
MRPHSALSTPFLTVLLIAAWLGAVLAPAAVQAKMVSVNRPVVNMRSGPGEKSKVIWKLERGYPLQVIGKRSNWYRVRDFEGDVGWVYGPLTSRQPHVVVKKSGVNVRSGPGVGYQVLAKADRGVVFRTMKNIKGWVQVRHQTGVNGWVARHLVWGW